jgi:hypothetical protein
MSKPKPLPGGTNEAQNGGTSARVRGGGGRRRHAPDNGASGDDPREQRLNSLLEQFGGGGFRLLAERTTSDGTTEYLGPVPFNSDLYESVRLRWGGGLYGGRIVNERGQYQSRFPQFRIAGLPRQPGHDDASAHGAASTTPAPGLETTLASITATLAKISERLERAPAAPATDPLDQVAKVARVLRDMSASQGAASPVNSMGMVRELYGFLREIREEVGPVAEDNGFGVVMREGVGPLVQVLTRKLELEESRERRRLSPGGVRAATPSAQATAAPPAPPAVEDTETVDAIPSDELEALLMTVPTAARRFLLSCAENEEDPEDYVSMLLNKLSDEGFDAMVRNLPRSDFLDVLVKVVPAYGQHRAWFSRLISALREAVAAAAEADEADGAASSTAPAQGASA